MRERSAPPATFTCATCEIAIEGPPTLDRGRPFCCAGCAANGPCICSYDAEPDDRHVRHCLDIEGAIRVRV